MKNNRSMSSLLAAATLAAAALGLAGVAQAEQVFWSVGVSSPGVQLGLANAPPMVLQQPVYSQPYPVYSQPYPVYSQAYPVYSQPYPVYQQPRPVYAAPMVYARPGPVYVAPPAYIRAGWRYPGYPGYAGGWRQGYGHYGQGHHDHDDRR